MSLAEELELCHQDIDKYPTSCLCRELSLEDRSTSCSELVPELIEQAVQTDEVNISIRRRLTNMETQTEHEVQVSQPNTSEASNESKATFSDSSSITSRFSSSLEEEFHGMQTDEDHGEDDIHGLPTTCSRSLVNREVAFTQTDMFVMPPKSSRCCCSQTQTDELQVSQPNTSDTSSR
ncbi:hypothetical protein GE061_008584 [Apolygus lucorum]|uniref:Uncharacterized protein n=1 Tax=Apolygus lucorum TaxID=248454 RepID=A0A8S9WN16_APOLU|nr:hypothetical protein GE061_008584 [Apolygus lucorum]